ncbi:hypothetical protein Rhe02_34420 [Rhizocola hellebori]|uniref:Histidine kinase/HSP90-like ATPase domain-containing protein n=1 Tax=Rhizocola hellebori TaxID=1392758 RepID=A0A8J3Q987_9ACTN|nr:ATP-binding protein [Rhizocola hellebori]GIH05375.1 hypothetical protein Rhe02_34420 [Rhizocola hellebori]
MGLPASRQADTGGADTASAGPGARRTLTVLVAAMRLSSGVLGAVVAIAGMAPPAQPGLVIAGSVGVLLWSGLFARQVLRHGPSPILIYIDVIVVAVLLVAHRWLVPEQVRMMASGTGWVDIVAGAGVLITQFGLRQPIGLAAGLGIAAVYAVGDGQISEAPVFLAVAALIGAGLATLVHRATSSADAALAELAEQRRAAIVRAAIRADERNHQRHLHDTVLATLTMVHTGGIASDSVALRERAAADLLIIESLREGPSGPQPSLPKVRLDLMLRFAAVQPPASTPLNVSVDVSPIELPAEVATAMSQCVAEALTNVARHAGTGEAGLEARADADGASITVRDSGVGFDVTSVPAHRRGLRESIDGRMRSVGGSASVRSEPGLGTQVVLRWPDV